MKEAHEKEVEKYIDEATLEEIKTSNYKADLIKVQDELEQELKVKVESNGYYLQNGMLRKCTCWPAVIGGETS